MSENLCGYVKVPEINISNSMRYAFDQIKSPIAVRDLSSRLIYCNQPLADLLSADSPERIMGKYDYEIDSVLLQSENVIEEFDKQYKKVCRTRQPFSTLEIHPHAVDYPYIFKKIPFFDDNHECVGMFGYNVELAVYSLNDYIKGHMPGSLLLNKPDDFFTERECEIMFYRLQGLKSKDAAARLNLSLNTFNNYMQALYTKVGASNLDDFKEYCQQRNYHRYLPKRFLTNEAINFSSSII